jgi:radical SAM protein with 4Fe4S-binding SPASM domain
MNFNENEVYIFNPDYKMRNDLRRIIMFSGSKSNYQSVPNWDSFLHPLHAQIFSFFTFNRTLKVTISLLGEYLKRDEYAIRKIIMPYIENIQSVYTIYKDEKIRIPKNVIVNRNRIAGKVDFLGLDPNIFSCQRIDLTTQRLFIGPQLLTFMLNNTCISNCIYCYADTKTQVKKKLSTNRILELIDEAKKLPVHLINLMGGEIFLHPDWFNILKKLVDVGLSPDYISTKYPLNSNIIHSIQETSFSNPVQISLDSCSSDLLQKTLSIKSDYLPKLLQGIKDLDNSGLKYRINSVLTIYNINKEVIECLFRFISGLKNIIDWRITPAVDSIWIAHEQFKRLKPHKMDIETLYSFIDNEIRPYTKIPILLNRGAINREFFYCSTGSKDFKGVECSALNSHFFILPDGNVTICEQLYWMPQFIIGNVTKNSISEVWNSTVTGKLLNLKRIDIQDSSPCKNCKLFEPCFKARNRCWVDIVKTYGKENWDYPDPRCAYAPPMYNNMLF